MNADVPLGGGNPRPPNTMSYEARTKTFIPTKVIPRSKQSIAAENAKYDAEVQRYQANAAFLAKVAEGETISMKALREQATQEKTFQQYPIQGRTFESNPPTFQPLFTTPSWAYKNQDGW